MSDIRWTLEQRAAIQEVGRSVSVSAAAGSGKTAVLAERCAYLICDAPPPHRCRIDELLVVTFTKAAAAEMTTRIRTSLIERRDAEPCNDYLREQAALVETAHISTIDSFCQWVLRRWFDEAGIDPAATVLPADEARILIADTLDNLVADRYASGGADGRSFRRLVDVYGLGDDAAIKRFVLRLADLLDSLPDPEAWLADARRRLVDQPDLLWNELISVLGRELAHQSEHAKQYQRLADSNDRRVAFYGRLLNDHASQLDAWRQAIASWPNGPNVSERGGPTAIIRPPTLDGVGDAALSDEAAIRFDALCRQIVDYELTARGAPRKNKDATEAEVAQQEAARGHFDTVLGRFRKRIRGRFARFTHAEIADGLKATAPYLAALFDLVRDLRSVCLLRKRQAGVVDFADLERCAFDVLNRDDVASAVRNRFAHVLVDEYQDINRLQAALLDRASRPDASGEPTNLFTVGDVKQSIYRFRLAEPNVFLERLDRQGRDPCRGNTILLRKNFRSRPHILNGVNQLFGRLMRPEVGGIAYGPDEALHAGRETDGTDVPPTIEVHLLERVVEPGVSDDYPDVQAMVDPDDPAEWETIEREAYLIATRIREIFDGDLTIDGSRKPSPEDVAILLRAPAYRAERMAGVLRRLGIETYPQVHGTMLDATEIRDVRALLQVLDNSQQDIPLASVLRSRVIGLPLTEDDLLAIRTLDRRVPFHEAARRYVHDGTDERIRLRLARVLRRIGEHRKAMRERPFADVLWEVLDRAGYIAYVGGLPGGAQRRANLLGFHERAREFGTFKAQGLGRFLQFIESLEQSEQDIGAPAPVTEAADAVRIMSIHAAKGLEFPIVFVADLGRKFNLDDARGRMILDRDAGVGLHVVDEDRMIEYPTVAHHLAADNIERSTRAEELRVLYVAMTRARDMLFLVGSTSLDSLESQRRLGASGDHPLTPVEIESAMSPLDWIIPAVVSMPREEVRGLRSADSVALPDRPSGPPLFRIVAHRSDSIAGWRIGPYVKQQASPLHLAVARLAELPSDEPLTAPESVEVDPVLEIIRFDYPHLAASSVRAVVAASEVKRRYDVFRDPDERAGAFIAAHSLAKPADDPSDRQFDEPRADRAAARQLGTATHKVLEHLDFSAAGDPAAVELQFERFVASGLLTPEEAGRMSADTIVWFVQTRLGCAVRDAGDAYRREFMFIAAHPARWFDATLGQDINERVLVRGIVDGILPSNDGIEVIDFKTDSVRGEEIARRAECYRRQMELYAASIGPIFGKPVTHCRLVFLHPREIVTLENIT